MITCLKSLGMSHTAFKSSVEEEIMLHKEYIEEFNLLLIANQLLQEHEDYIEGIRATTVEEKDEILIFKGDYFLDERGLPTTQTPIVFNLFKYLAHQLSKQFTLTK